MDITKQRIPLTLALFSILTSFVYIYLYELILVVIVFVSVWKGYDYIQDLTKEALDPTGKYIFITGCDSGFGLASAKALRDIGFGVIAGCYDDNSEGAKELRNRPWVKKIEVLSLDVANERSVVSCAKEIKDICRDQGLWAVINNAGIHNAGPTELVSMEWYHRVAAVNLFGAVRVTKAVLPLIRQAKGRVINCTSERGFNPWGNNSAYCLSKFGLEAFSACLRNEMVKFNVQVITVAPGSFGGGTALGSNKVLEDIQESLLRERSMLDKDDQQTYPTEDIEKITEDTVAIISKSCLSLEPVVNAYVDAVMNSNPRRCYLVQGTQRQYLDPYIICAYIRPFLPYRLMSYTEDFLLQLFG